MEGTYLRKKLHAVAGILKHKFYFLFIFFFRFIGQTYFFTQSYEICFLIIYLYYVFWITSAEIYKLFFMAKLFIQLNDCMYKYRYLLVRSVNAKIPSPLQLIQKENLPIARGPESVYSSNAS